MPKRSRTTARRRWNRFLATSVVLIAVAAAGMALYLNRHETTHAETPSAGDPESTRLLDAGQARTGLDRLTVAWNRNWESYDRNAFGPGWSGRGGEPTLSDGCTAREDVMKRDLTETRVGDSNSCLVLTGTLIDPYTGERLPYDRFKASDIEIDHVVALGDAWRSGASAWSPEQREKFANDLGNLLAVQKQANQDKGSKTPDQWKPRDAYWCEYARRWVSVKSRWGLTVQPTEKSALADMLDSCSPPVNR
ncbi:HNH endonuclease family protein [Nocardia sp. JMUB6875]|uniref:HNH endonuclease family protein n=1 Tax=Nocardia sp. JMUB6875 TaxID=3158170 RepID=UPI0032E62444